MTILGINDLKKFSKEEQHFIIDYGAFRVNKYKFGEFEALCSYIKHTYGKNDSIPILGWLSAKKNETFLGQLCYDEVFICGEDNTPIPMRFLKKLT